MPTFEEILACPQQFLDQRSFREAMLELLLISGGSFDLAVARNQVPGVEEFFKFGLNSEIDTTTDPEDVWEGGGLYTGQPVHSDAAETIEIFSSDATDNLAGVGAHTLRVSGLDENWDYAEEDFSMDAADGTIPTTSVSLWRRVFRVVILTAGTSGGNAGVITVRHTTTTANVFSAVPIQSNQSRIAAYTVPLGKTLYLNRIMVAMGRLSGALASATYSFRAREEGQVYQTKKVNVITTAFADITDSAEFFVFPEKTDLLFRVENVSDNDVSVSAEVSGYLIDD